MPAAPHCDPSTPAKQAKYEQDDAADEAVPSLDALLLPDGRLPLSAAAGTFAIAYNNHALEGWVKQRAPICAAASIAGAWNAATGAARGARGALSTDAALALLVDLAEERRVEREEAVKRLLMHGVAEVRGAVAARLEARGLSFGGRRKAGATPKQCTAALRAEAAERRLCADAPPLNTADGLPTDVFTSLADVWGFKDDERARAELARHAADDAPPAPAGAAAAAAGGDDDDDDGDDDDDAAIQSASDEDEEDDGKAAAKKPKGKKAGGKKAGGKKGSASKPLDQLVDEALAAWWRNLITAEKMRNEPVPSTSGIGNWGLLQACEQAHERAGDAARADVRARGRLLMGRGSSAALPLRLGDGDAQVDAQWRGLWAAFATPRSCIVFHLTNHYAVVFALREWHGPGGVVRQLLTARKGQRPSAWIDFGEARSIMLKWQGYKMLQVTVDS